MSDLRTKLEALRDEIVTATNTRVFFATHWPEDVMVGITLRRWINNLDAILADDPASPAWLNHPQHTRPVDGCHLCTKEASR
jgi:hypothetical protein